MLNISSKYLAKKEWADRFVADCKVVEWLVDQIDVETEQVTVDNGMKQPGGVASRLQTVY